MILRAHISRFVAVACLVSSVAFYAQSSSPVFVNTLMPLPSTVEPRAGVLRMNSTFSYALDGDHGPRLSAAAARLAVRIGRRSGIYLYKIDIRSSQTPTLIIHVDHATEKPVPQPDDDESYVLDIDTRSVSLSAKTDIGALRGMETLLQLIQPLDGAYVLPCIHIADKPRFVWRGLMLDPGRHFLPVSNIQRTLDGMAAVKLNVLHWHLTEDQGFRIESKLFPKLATLGSSGQFYTQQEIRDVIAYASDRGIRVVPEFDMPGHSQSWMVGNPYLASAPGPYAIAEQFGIKDAAMDPTRESTYRFLEAFLGEMARLFPDPYIHVGGDESNGKQWLANQQIHAFMQAHGFKTTAELQTYFNTRVQRILAEKGKQMVGWDEILSPDLPREAVIQNWHGTEFLVNAAKLGHRGMLSSPYYLDHMKPASDMFLADPLPGNSGLTPEQAKLILGGEACMWGEHVDADSIDSRIWPRTAAIAERLWSPASDRDVDDMYRRLDAENLRLEEEDLRHLSRSARGLRRLAGSTQIQQLELLAHTLQPVGFYERLSEQQPSSFTVFNLLVDAIRPDPPLRHEMPKLIDAALKGDSASMDRLDALFCAWVAAGPVLKDLEGRSPLLQQAHEHIDALPKLGAMGVEAIARLRSGTALPTGWRDAQLRTLRDANKPSELVEFVVLAPLRKLVDAVSVSNNSPEKTARLGQSTFTNPIKDSGPDPWIYAWQGTYYYMNTQVSNITLWKTRDISDLRHAESKMVWRTESGSQWSSDVWAPEITRWGGKWYIYFCADEGKLEHHRLYLLENASADPMDGEWVFKGKIDGMTDDFAIDPDVFELNGMHYLLWSGWESDRNREQRIYLAQLKNPWTAASKRVEIARPIYDWEKHGDIPGMNLHIDVNEGPEALVHGDRIFVVFSASGCWTDDYALGTLQASPGTNLLDPKSWKKIDHPLLSKDPVHGIYAPGHNGFFRSPDGTDWIVYHANPKSGQGCGDYRSPRIQPFTWNADGTPNFGMPAPAGVELAKPR